MDNTIATLVEDQSIARPPLFTGSNYVYCSTGMMIYMQTNGYEIWNATQVEYVISTTNYATLSNTQKVETINNAKAMNIYTHTYYFAL